MRDKLRWVDDWVKAPLELWLLWVVLVCSDQYLSEIVKGRNAGEPGAGSWVAKAH